MSAEQVVNRTDWQRSLQFAVNAEHVSNLDPAVGGSVRLRLKVWKDAPLRGIDVRAVLSGHSARLPMRRTREGARFAWWEAALPIPHAGLIHWHFLCHTDAGPRFFTRGGVQTINPTEDRDWTLLPGFAGADWVHGAVFYQIFPDRFCKGDPSVGRRPGEYRFDGGEPRIMDWLAPPPSYAEGRCLDFYNGDLAGIARKLDYLSDLGVGALYLTPVFRARTTHRYDCIDYFHVDEALGGDAALAALTAAAHARGMRVVLDVSLNHTGSDHPWLARARRQSDAPEAGFYYPDGRGGHACWWDVPTLPQLNYGSRALRRIIWEGDDALVRHWLKPPWQIDGWRFDVANMTGRHGPDQFGHAIWRGVRRAVKAEQPDAYIVGEHWEDAGAYLRGDEWDGAMNYFGCASPLRRWLGERVRFEADGPDFPPQPRAPATGQELAAMLRQTLDRLPCQHVALQLNLLGSHDIHRLHHGPAFDWACYRGAVMLQFLLPGAPSIWYGDEVGLGGHADSVEGCRYPMEWREERWDHGFHTLYRTLARLKRDEPVLNDGTHCFLSTGTRHLAFARHGRGRAYVAVLNNAAEPSRIELPLAVMGLCDAAREVFDGRCFRVRNGVLALDLAPRENLLLTMTLTD
ncbi:MAG: glycoside hydrolase family 13 protein [Thiohalocapsa sp.]|uniref:glycoside hydrolase family 13 protein n=1 Tax=Thiohalocapsa sp. TaxID=2497641 RepID=UPI0025E668EE|nr:glycoside hydrolase family 13 protein [Thiohalocapsa sp.]MCG6940978.1 glycoside hydrolase family 13 protein [Thiohalocapsa sp.]